MSSAAADGGAVAVVSRRKYSLGLRVPSGLLSGLIQRRRKYVSLSHCPCHHLSPNVYVVNGRLLLQMYACLDEDEEQWLIRKNTSLIVAIIAMK